MGRVEYLQPKPLAALFTPSQTHGSREEANDWVNLTHVEQGHRKEDPSLSVGCRKLASNDPPSPEIRTCCLRERGMVVSLYRSIVVS
jgi:hypothetical protein